MTEAQPTDGCGEFYDHHAAVLDAVVTLAADLVEGGPNVSMASVAHRPRYEPSSDATNPWEDSVDDLREHAD